MRTSSSSRAACSPPTTPVDARELSARLQSVRSSAFRLETLQYYAGDDEELDEYRRGLPLREWSVRTSPYLRRLAAATLAGQQWSRVHVVTQPLSDYVRFELASYIGSAAVGEQIAIADVSASAELSSLIGHDFWLVDDDRDDTAALMMSYGSGGDFQGASETSDPATLEMCRAARRLAWRHAVGLNAFIASAGLRVA